MQRKTLQSLFDEKVKRLAEKLLTLDGRPERCVPFQSLSLKVNLESPPPEYRTAKYEFMYCTHLFTWIIHSVLLCLYSVQRMLHNMLPLLCLCIQERLGSLSCIVVIIKTFGLLHVLLIIILLLVNVPSGGK